MDKTESECRGAIQEASEDFEIRQFRHERFMKDLALWAAENPTLYDVQVADRNSDVSLPGEFYAWLKDHRNIPDREARPWGMPYGQREHWVNGKPPALVDQSRQARKLVPFKDFYFWWPPRR